MSAITFFGLVGITTWAFSLIPHMDGFLRVSDAQQMQAQQVAAIASLRQQVTSAETERIAGELLQLRVQHCKSKSEGERELLWQRIATLMFRYQQLTNQAFPLATCTDL